MVSVQLWNTQEKYFEVLDGVGVASHFLSRGVQNMEKSLLLSLSAMLFSVTI
jgi:hypothetical protein